MKFKVGDKIIGNEKADDIYTWTKKGWEGVVTEVRGDGFHAGAHWNLSYDCFDLVEEPLKVGDKVEIIDGCEFYRQGMDGARKKVGEVKSSKDGTWWWVDWDNGYRNGYIPGEHIRKIQEPSIQFVHPESKEHMLDAFRFAIMAQSSMPLDYFGGGGTVKNTKEGGALDLAKHIERVIIKTEKETKIQGGR